jgi:uncharacterized protein (TIGR02266 family)
MTQDTRKDRRVKIVSLNVRYKSATVDEFIENHAHDVSRGGIYIKTGSPFPPGTLLKFEIRLVSDQALIMGVGRVVWKRDTTQGTGDRPAGMGVKFIKIDEPSKAVIDRLMSTRSDAGRAYESEAEATASPSDAAPSAVRAAPSRVGKSTMLGVGSLPQPGAGSSPSTRPAGTPSAPPRPAATIAMFPKANPEADAEPKQEQTVMKQAAELLEEALREAGGSMEDVGTNPLFAGSGPAPKSTTSDGPADALKFATSDAPGVPSSSSAPEAMKARAMVAGLSPAGAAKKVTSDPPRTARESPLAKTPTTALGTRPTSVRPAGRPSLSSVSSRPRKKGASGTLLLLGVVAAAAIAGVTFRDKLFGTGSTAEPPETSSAAQAAPQPSPVVSATPSADLAASASTPAASAAPADSASASPAASAVAPAPAASESAAAIPRTPSPAPRPAFARPTPAQTAAVPIGPKPPAPSSITAMTGEPVAPGPATPPTAAPAPAVKSKPTPTPTAKPSDDNPY